MASTISSSLLLVAALAPLAGAGIAGFAGKAVGQRGAHSATILGVAISFVTLLSIGVIRHVATRHDR